MTDISRRTLTKGIAWSAPVIIATTTIPAYAASRFTGKTTAAYLYSDIKSRTPFGCSTSTNPQQGYIDTTGTGNDPAASNGLWFESSTTGTVRMDSATITYTFNHPIQIISKPTNMTWTTPTTYNGWTVTQPTQYTIRLTKSMVEGTESTSTLNTGTNFGGYFINFKVLDGCYGDAVVTVKTDATVNYTDSTGSHTYTKNTIPQGI